jgi:hypothetical protein
VGGAGTADQLCPPFDVRRTARQVLLPQGASPNTHAASSDTKVTEFGANPAGTAAPGVGCAVGVGDDEIGVAVGVVTAVGATVGVGDVGPGDGAHAVSNTQAAPAEATRNRIEAVVCVINTANSIETMRVTWRPCRAATGTAEEPRRGSRRGERARHLVSS